MVELCHSLALQDVSNFENADWFCWSRAKTRVLIFRCKWSYNRNRFQQENTIRNYAFGSRSVEPQINSEKLRNELKLLRRKWFTSTKSKFTVRKQFAWTADASGEAPSVARFETRDRWISLNSSWSFNERTKPKKITNQKRKSPTSTSPRLTPH